MKRIHPNASHAVALAALAASIGALGCQSNSGGGIANPFLAPDRVPPPATRAILPGQAQPYYPGDPLPVMQSNTAPSVDANGLAWNATSADSTPPSSPPAPPSATVASEPTVAIPADGDSLRFALPGPIDEPAPIAPIAPQPVELAAEAQSQGVSQASYSEPVLSEAPALISPWQPPQIAPPELPPPPVVPQVASQTPVVQPVIAQPYQPMQLAAAPQAMDVRLRAVASPPPEPLPNSSPRIRLPGEVVASQPASSDGFRPRSSMR